MFTDRLSNVISVLFILGIQQTYTKETSTEIVTTNSGKLQGSVEEVDSRKLLKFLNIPYAKPPVGRLRLEKPVPYGPWGGVRDATEFGHVCLQDLKGNPVFKDYEDMVGPQSEDCLTLNIYVPDKITKDNKRPVMLWIHGGGYVIGDGKSYDGTYLSLGGDVIVVTINYRLGLLGFLSTGDANSPGNYGLHDQIMSFQWVHDNIEAFGGDPESVTIFGESAGGFSASLQTLIPQNKGLFQRAIVQSGSAMAAIATSSKYLDLTLASAKEFGCVDNTTTIDTLNKEDIVACLREFPAEKIPETQTAAVGQLGMQMDSYFGPVEDGDLLKRSPIEILQDKKSEEYNFFRSIDTIVGTTNLEGALFTFFFEAFQESMNFNVTDGLPKQAVCESILPSLAEVFFGDKKAADFYCDEYTDEDKIQQGRDLIDLMGDIFFVAPTVRLLDFHTEGGNSNAKSYQYLFTYETPRGLLMERAEWLKGKGSEHGTDIVSLFGPDGFTKFVEEKIGDVSSIREKMIKYWSNFAKSSDPNSDGIEEWPEYVNGVGNYVSIGGDDVRLGTKIHAKRMAKIIEIIPEKLKNIKTEL